MRIAIHQTSEVGLRAARIVLAEPELLAFGLLDRDPRDDHDDRITRADNLSDYDAVIVDDLNDVDAVAERAVADATAVCVWNEFDASTWDSRFIDRTSSILVGSNLATGIAPALAQHERARGGHLMDVTVAWTEPGTPLRRGEAVPFPDPVGARWAKRREVNDETVLVAPIDGEWAGAMARVTSATDSGVVTRMVGVADLATHLEALALAAGAIALARGAFPLGATTPTGAAEAYLATALNAGLGVAAYELQED